MQLNSLDFTAFILCIKPLWHEMTCHMLMCLSAFKLLFTFMWDIIKKICIHLNAYAFIILEPIFRDQPNSRGKNAWFHGRFSQMCQISQKIHERSLDNSRPPAPTDVISRCCANANKEISDQRIFTTLSQDSRQSRVTVWLRQFQFWVLSNDHLICQVAC